MEIFVCSVVGMLKVLCELLPTLAEGDLGRVYRMVLPPEMLVVMAHHGSIQIRTAVVKVRSCNDERILLTMILLWTLDITLYLEANL